MREFWIKATGSQDMGDRDREDIDLTIPGEDRWIYTHIQTVNPGTNSVAMKTKWIKAREIDPSAPDYKKLAEDLAGALESQPQIVYETLLECTAWLGIPEKKRDAFISERYENIKFIVDKHLSAYRAAVGK